MPISDKTRRQRELDQLAFGILDARHTGPETWMCWTDWFELTKARQGDLGLGPATFSDCIRRLMDQGKVKRSQIAKNRFYGVIFTSGSSPEVISSHDSAAPTSDKAVQALEHLLNRKSFDVV